MQIDYFIGHKIFTLAKANVRYRDVGNRDIFFFYSQILWEWSEDVYF